MGYSLRGGKPETAEWFRQNQHNITRVLDIGAGSGTYAKLIKQEFDLCKDAEWTAVEAWPEYIEKFQLASLYNHVINQDVRTLDWSSLGHFSVAIAGDVLEHMTKQQAIDLVNNILQHADTLIVSIPIVYMPQDEVDGNPYEVHVKPDWSHDEVMETWAPVIKHFYRKSVKSKLAVYWLSANA
jgi:2-polyprenyl-3-methyl-5-hydroxy-6-metoxy-1,4-benzoquinol methylase